jgi:hypothetical protein
MIGILAALKVLAALACIGPAVAHYRGWYGWHPDADLVLHGLAGFGLAGLFLLKVQPAIGFGLVLAVALTWEFFEPRFSWITAGGFVDTLTDILAVLLGAGLLVAALTALT